MTREKYIHDENLKLFRKVLAETTDDEKRRRLIDLIRDEVAKEVCQKAKIGYGSPPNAFVLASHNPRNDEPLRTGHRQTDAFRPIMGINRS
jgi:hypothetical protein